MAQSQILTKRSSFSLTSGTAPPHFCHSPEWWQIWFFTHMMMNIHGNDTLNCGYLSSSKLRARAAELVRVAEMARDRQMQEQLRSLANRYLAIADRPSPREQGIGASCQ
jgi:hypothetical protein